jgi:hypothetical protein
VNEEILKKTYDVAVAIIKARYGKIPTRVYFAGSSSSGRLSEPGRTRPLCEYPTWQKYKGFGDPNLASSFTCSEY